MKVVGKRYRGMLPGFAFIFGHSAQRFSAVVADIPAFYSLYDIARKCADSWREKDASG